MKFKNGILYCISNSLWNSNIHKIGNTRQTLKSRLSTIQTSLYVDCEIVAQTDELVCCLFWEKILEKLLAPYRVNPKREFYYIDKEEIEMIFNFINEFNKILDTREKLSNFIQQNYPDYYYKKRIYNSDNSNNINKIKPLNDKPKRKKKRGLFIDTSY